MKIINDTQFEVQALPIQKPDGKSIMSIIVKGTFCFSSNHSSISDKQLPILFGDEYYNEHDGGSVKFESDLAFYKPKTDIVLVGSAYSPHTKPVEYIDVLLSVGDTQKKLRVFGNRVWESSSNVFSKFHPSKPKPFSIMEIIYERAFGGLDKNSGEFCKENIVGKGFISKNSKNYIHGTPLPNIENPNNLIETWKDQPTPEGFGFYSKFCEPRSLYIGTYDEKWRKKRSPNLPDDFSVNYYNAAHPDLQVKGYLKGNEKVKLKNLVPVPEGNVTFNLCGKITKCDIIKTFRNNITKKNIPINLDTICFIPDQLLYYLVWRGNLQVLPQSTLEKTSLRIYYENII